MRKKEQAGPEVCAQGHMGEVQLGMYQLAVSQTPSLAPVLPTLWGGQRCGVVIARCSHRCRAAHQHGGAAEALGHHPGRTGYAKDTMALFLLEVGASSSGCL